MTEEEFYGTDWKSLSDEEILQICGATERELRFYRLLQKSLKPARLRHSLGVMAYAMALASPAGEETVCRARLAGLLHDCAKYEAGALEHGPKGAEKARDVFGVSDPEVLSAIRWHTTGRADMSLLEKLLYVADYAEPFRRPLPGLETIRRTAFADPDRAVGLCAAGTLHYLEEQGIPVDPSTREAALCYAPDKEEL